MQDITVTAVGNLTAEPQLRVVGSGAQVCSFRIGITPRHRDRASGEWVDGTSMFLSVSCWRRMAQNAHATLHKGDRVFVTGRLRQRSYTTQLGEERTAWEVDAELVAPDLGRHVASLSKPEWRPAPSGADQPTATATTAAGSAEPDAREVQAA